MTRRGFFTGLAAIAGVFGIKGKAVPASKKHVIITSILPRPQAAFWSELSAYHYALARDLHDDCVLTWELPRENNL